MTTFKDLEDSLKNFLIQEQSDAHQAKNLNVAKYNNIKFYADPTRYHQKHFIVRISISEAVFSMEDCTKLNGGLGYEERFVTKWFSRMGNKEKLNNVWNSLDEIKK